MSNAQASMVRILASGQLAAHSIDVECTNKCEQHAEQDYDASRPFVLQRSKRCAVEIR